MRKIISLFIIVLGLGSVHSFANDQTASRIKALLKTTTKSQQSTQKNIIYGGADISRRSISLQTSA